MAAYLKVPRGVAANLASLTSGSQLVPYSFYYVTDSPRVVFANGVNSYIQLAALSTANVFTQKQTAPLLNLTHGSAPGSPADGDVWTTTAGIFVRVNGATVGPLGPSTPLSVANRTALAAVSSPSDGDIRYLAESGREGIFKFSTANLSAMVTIDTVQGKYVAPSAAPTGASGAWVRIGYQTADPRWYGLVVNSSGAAAANLTAWNVCRAIEMHITMPLGTVWMSDTFRVDTAYQTVIFPQQSTAYGDGTGTRVISNNKNADVVCIGPNTAPGGGVANYPRNIVVKNIAAGWGVALDALGGADDALRKAIRINYLIEPQIEYPWAHEAPIGIYIYGVVGGRIVRPKSYRGTAIGGTDKFFGIWAQGTPAILAGGNASLHLIDAVVEMSAALSLSDEVAFYLNGSISDVHVSHLETSGVANGLRIDGTGSGGSNSSNINVQFDKIVVDTFTNNAVSVTNVAPGGSVDIDRLEAMSAAGASHGVYISGNGGRVSVKGRVYGEGASAAAGTMKGVYAENSTGVDLELDLINCPRPTHVAGLTDFRLKFNIRNTTYDANPYQAAFYYGGLTRGVVDLSVRGKNTAFPQGAYGPTNDNSDVTFHGLESIQASAISGGAANKLFINGVAVTKQGTYTSAGVLSSTGTITVLGATSGGGINATTINPVTFNSSGGAAAGSTFDGASAVTVDFSTVGALASTNPSVVSGTLGTVASTTGAASLRVPHGTAPTSPTNGDIWTTTAGLYARINGATVGPFTSSAPGGISDGDKGDIDVASGGTLWTVQSLTGVSGVVNAPVGTTIRIGDQSPTSGSVNRVDLGASFHGGPGTGQGSSLPKIVMFNDGANVYGFDVSSAQLDYHAPAGATHNFYIGNTRYAQITTTQLILPGQLSLASSTSDPSTPGASTGLLYAKTIAERVMPKWIGPSGVDYPLQSHVGFNNVRGWRGGATTTASTFASTLGSMPYTGASPTAPTIPALASTNLLTQTNRSTISTGGTAGALAYIRGNQTQFWRGNAAGLGGFFVNIRFAVTGTLQAGLRAFAGIVDVTANPTNVDPTTTSTPGGVGLAHNANTGNWKLVHNVTGTARTAVDLGANFAINNTHMLEITLFAPPNGSGINYRVTNLSNGAIATGTLTTNIPASTTFMTPSIWITNNATAAAQTLDFISCYVETDY